jgi:hypothetical protein
MTFPAATRLLNQAASYLDDHARYAEAEPLYVRALSVREQQLGTEHPHTQVIRGNYALLLHTIGRDEEATGPDMKRTLSS